MAAVEKIYFFKCPSPNPVIPEGRGVPGFARLRESRYLGFMPRQPQWGSESYKEFLGDCWLPGQSKGPCKLCSPGPGMWDPGGHLRYPSTLLHSHGSLERENYWNRMLVQNKFSAKYSLLPERSEAKLCQCFFFFFPRSILHISLVAPRKWNNQNCVFHETIW